MLDRLSLRQLAFAVGLVVLVGSAVGYVWVQRPLADAIATQHQLARNTGRIMTLDEILTMSARMAAAAKDPAYEARYNAHVDELDALIKQTLALVRDDETARAVASTDAANLRLVAMETRSFELGKEQRHAEALALLESAAYRADKATYAGGMLLAFERMGAITAAQRTSVARRAWLLLIAALGALVVVASAWLLEQRDKRRTLARRNDGMRIVLDNVAQGFVTIDLDGALASERSAILDRWFGPPAPGATLVGYLESVAPSYARWLQVGLAELRDETMPADVVIAQLPGRFAVGDRTYDVAYNAIGGEAAPASLLVIISDVTATLAHERAEREQRDLMSLFQRISIDRAGVEEFLAEAAQLVAALRSETDPVVQMRLVHTLKGNCAIYGLQSYADAAHAVECELSQTHDGLTAEQRDGMVELWKRAMARVAPLLGASTRDLIEVERGELEAALAQSVMASRELHELLASWTRQPIARRFERLARQIVSLSSRKGRPDPTIRMVGEQLRLDSERWLGFWSAIVHVVRNTVDHGIEDADERERAGKPAAGVIELRAERSDGRIVFTFRDDGRGIDWERVRARAVECGLPSTSRADLTHALFSDGLTTRDAVTDLSGRGVGLSAVREAVVAAGGSFEVESERGRGTTFRFSFDERATAATTPRTRQAPTSLLPFAWSSGASAGAGRAG